MIQEWYCSEKIDASHSQGFRQTQCIQTRIPNQFGWHGSHSYTFAKFFDTKISGYPFLKGFSNRLSKVDHFWQVWWRLTLFVSFEFLFERIHWWKCIAITRFCQAFCTSLTRSREPGNMLVWKLSRSSLPWLCSSKMANRR